MQSKQALLEPTGLFPMLLLKIKMCHFKLIKASHQFCSLRCSQVQLSLRLGLLIKLCSRRIKVIRYKVIITTISTIMPIRVRWALRWSKFNTRGAKIARSRLLSVSPIEITSTKLLFHDSNDIFATIMVADDSL